jgi:hypothetical protein
MYISPVYCSNTFSKQKHGTYLCTGRHRVSFSLIKFPQNNKIQQNMHPGGHHWCKNFVIQRNSSIFPLILRTFM